MTFSASQIEAIRARRAAGESYAGIAADYACHKNTIRRAIHDAPLGKARCFRPGGFSAFGRDQRAKILELLQAGPMTTDEIRDGLGGCPCNHLTDLRKRGIIKHKTVWVIK